MWDFLGNPHIKCEISAQASEKHLKGLKAMAESFKLKRQIIVSRDLKYRKIGSVEVYTYADFLGELWSGKI